MSLYDFTLAAFVGCGGVPNVQTLQDEIAAVITRVPCDGVSIRWGGDYCGIGFAADLDAGELAALAAVVAAHGGAAPPEADGDPPYTLKVTIPGTPTVPAGGTGNADTINLPGPGFRMIIPAPGTGPRNVDLATAYPVPAGGDGYWDVDPDTGEITPSATPGAADWHLLTIPVEFPEWRGPVDSRWTVSLVAFRRRFRAAVWIKKGGS